jgi:quercetin dioxygenase-like cupin family protein
MAISHLASGEVASLLPLNDRLEQTPTTALFKDEQLEVMRIVLSKSKRVPEHAVDGAITIQCIEGEVTIHMGNTEKTVLPGDLLYMAPGTPHELFADKNSSLLVTIALPHSPNHAERLH